MQIIPNNKQINAIQSWINWKLRQNITPEYKSFLKKEKEFEEKYGKGVKPLP